MKFNMDFITNSSSGTMLVTFTATLQAIDVQKARQAFAEAQQFIFNTYSPDADESESIESDSADILAPASWPELFGAIPADADESDRQPAETLHHHYRRTGQADVSLLTVDKRINEDGTETTLVIPLALSSFLNTIHPHWWPQQVELARDRTTFWQDFLAWYNRQFQDHKQLSDIAQVLTEEFLSYGESEQDAVDVIAAFLQSGLAHAIWQPLAGYISGVIYEFGDLSDGYQRISRWHGPDRPAEVEFVLNETLPSSQKAQPSQMIALLQHLLDEAAISPATIGLDPERLMVLRQKGLPQAAVNMLGERQASLLYASPLFTNVIVWYGDIARIQAYPDLEKLLASLGWPTGPARR